VFDGGGPVSFYDGLLAHAGSTALVTEDGESVTYGRLASSADGIAGPLRSRSVAMVLCSDSFASVAGYLGFLRHRIVPLLVNGAMDAGLLASLLDAYRPGYVFAPALRTGDIPGGREIGSFGDYRVLELPCPDDLLLHEDLALLLTTSGSTGGARLVRLSYGNVDANARSIAAYLRITAADRAITTMPMNYTFGLSILNSHLLQGASIVLSGSGLMEPTFWRALREHRATTFGGVPFTYEMLRKLRFGRMDLPSLRVLTQAGGKLSEELVSEFVDLCGKKSMQLIVMYGQAEATARMSYLPWESARERPGSIGIAIPGGRFWIEDGRGEPVNTPGEAGELVYEGPNVSLGYAETWQDLRLGDSNHGVLRTGDLAHRDDAGFYYVSGRKKRFVKLYGNRVSLDETESLLRAAGWDCACSGTDDHLVIYVAGDDGQRDVRKYISARTGIHVAAFAVVHVGSIPRNDAGKVVYPALERGEQPC
jgi:acyl-coenzyme A synthetase/AMP-(fatty) acid ligase